MSEAILAIESSQHEASVAVRAHPGGPIAEVRVPPPERERDHLLAAIDAACRGQGVAPASIATVAVSCGPGGFTGLRVACASAKAIAEVTGCGLVAVPSALSAARAGARSGALQDGPCTVVLATKGVDAWCTDIELAGGMPASSTGALSRELSAAGGPVVAGAPLPPGWDPVARARGLVRAEWSAAACLEVAEVLGATLGRADPLLLQPIYPRLPEAVTLWEARHGAR